MRCFCSLLLMIETTPMNVRLFSHPFTTMNPHLSPPCPSVSVRRWEKAKKAREDKAKEEKEKKKAEAKPSLGDSMWGASVEKEEEVRAPCAVYGI